MSMRLRRMLPFILGAVVVSLHGQITLTKENLPAIGTVSNMEVDTTGTAVSGLTAKGETQQWNSLQPLAHAIGFDYKIVGPQDTPFGSKFPDADYASKSSVERIQLLSYPPILTTPVDTLLQPYWFEKIGNEQVTGLGMELNVSIFNGAYRFKNPAVFYPLPLEANKNWIYNAEIDTLISIIPGLSIPVSVVENADVTADAAGALTLNSGTFDCLRLRYHWTRKFFINASEIPQWTDSRIIYRWITGRIGVVLEVISKNKETNDEFTSAAQVTRLVSTNVSTGIGCPPVCRQTGLLPSGCSLGQNSPNPFNPSTAIRYTLSAPSRVELKVFSLLGRQIAVLDAGAKPAGDYTVVWNGKDRFGDRLPSGIYFYRLKAVPYGQGQAVVLTKKMIMTD
jgi:hypothetical protein